MWEELVLGAVILIIVVLVALIIVYRPEPLPPITPACSQLIEDVPDISTAPCCAQGGVASPQRFLINSDFVVASTPTDPNLVCPQFCSVSFNASTKTCSDATENTQVQNCFQQLNPTDCVGTARPVARVGSIPYYAIAVGDATCQEKIVC